MIGHIATSSDVWCTIRNFWNCSQPRVAASSLAGESSVFAAIRATCSTSRRSASWTANIMFMSSR